jgi:hypothetical protein
MRPQALRRPELSATENEALRERIVRAVAAGALTRAEIERACGYGKNGLTAFFYGRRGISAAGAARIRAVLEGKEVAAPPGVATRRKKRAARAAEAEVEVGDPFRAAVRDVLTEQFAGRVPDMAREIPMRALDLKRYLDGGRIRRVNRERIVERFELETAPRPTKRVKPPSSEGRSLPPTARDEGAGAIASRWQEEAMGLVLNVALKQ